MLSTRAQVMSAVVFAGVGAVAVVPAQAAPGSYEAEVLNNNPYVYYRFQQNQVPLTNAVEQDASPNDHDGTYRGAPVGGVAGAGAGSDAAVKFPGTSVTGLDYLKAATDAPASQNIFGFGSLLAQSSYEVVFKTNTANAAPATYQSIFGVFNQSDATTTPARTANMAVAVELNSNATGNLSATTSRFYVRDEDGIALGGTILNSVAGQYDLMDGGFHHLVFTYDTLGGPDDYIKGYVDGLQVTVSHVYQGGGNSANIPDNFLTFTRDPVYGARNVRGTVGNEADITLDEAALFANILSPADVAANFAATGIPEPSSLAAAGMAGVALIGRRRRRRA
jgi:hypothetical protein